MSDEEQGPLVTVTRSDYYGNKGYYMLPNLKPGKYRLRFTMPESYNEYGLTTWEIGQGESVGMDVVLPNETYNGFDVNGTAYGSFTADTLTFVTKDTIQVEAEDTDEKRVSYDIGVGLPVVYGGIAWLDENTFNEEHSFDGYYDHAGFPENPDNAHHVTDLAKEEHGFADGTGADAQGATIIAVEKGKEQNTDASGLPIPAVDMREEAW